MLSVLFCSDTLDGLCSAACVYRALKLKGMTVRIGGILRTESKERDLQELADQLNVGLFVIDFPPDAIPDLAAFLNRVSGRCTIAYWSFSQPQTPETLALLSQHVKRVDYAETAPGSFPKDKLSSTELAAFRFLPGDPVGRVLAKLAADIKFWLRQDERATKLADLIASGYDPKAIIEALSKGMVWDHVFEQARTDYLGKKAKAFEDLMKRLTIKEYLTYKLGFSLSAPILSTADACQYILDRHVAVDVAVVLYKSGKIAFRRRDGVDIDLAKLGKRFGGGGQKFASGGMFNAAVSVEHWDNVLATLDRALKDHFL